MKRLLQLLLLLSLSALPLRAQTNAPLLMAAVAETDTTALAVFFGPGKMIALTFHNPTQADYTGDLHTRLWQASSATAIPLADTPWKTLRVVAHQTVLEPAALDFPPVNVPTTFILQWLDNSNHLLGTTRVLVYPTNLLDELKRLLPQSGDNVGVLDPHRLLIPALNLAAIPFINLAEGSLTHFSGRLLLVGPCLPPDPEWDGLSGRLRDVARNGTPIVWFQPPPARPDQPLPSFYVVPENRATVVVAQPELVAGLLDQPQSQLNLIYYCQLALHPEPFKLPGLNPLPQL